jgi:hypothetical protein
MDSMLTRLAEISGRKALFLHEPTKQVFFFDSVFQANRYRAELYALYNLEDTLLAKEGQVPLAELLQQFLCAAWKFMRNWEWCRIPRDMQRMCLNAENSLEAIMLEQPQSWSFEAKWKGPSKHPDPGASTSPDPDFSKVCFPSPTANNNASDSGRSKELDYSISSSKWRGLCFPGVNHITSPLAAALSSNKPVDCRVSPGDKDWPLAVAEPAATKGAAAKEVAAKDGREVNGCEVDRKDPLPNPPQKPPPYKPFAKPEPPKTAVTQEAMPGFLKPKYPKEDRKVKPEPRLFGEGDVSSDDFDTPPGQDPPPPKREPVIFGDESSDGLVWKEIEQTPPTPPATTFEEKMAKEKLKESLQAFPKAIEYKTPLKRSPTARENWETLESTNKDSDDTQWGKKQMHGRYSAAYARSPHQP